MNFEEKTEGSLGSRSRIRRKKERKKESKKPKEVVRSGIRKGVRRGEVKRDIPLPHTHHSKVIPITRVLATRYTIFTHLSLSHSHIIHTYPHMHYYLIKTKTTYLTSHITYHHHHTTTIGKGLLQYRPYHTQHNMRWHNIT